VKNIFVIARYTLLDALKSKILHGVSLLGLIVFFISSLVSTYAFGNPKKVALDLGLGLMAISLLGIALFMGVSLISKEIRERTIYLTLARGVSRSHFLIGKVLGLSAVLFLNTLILTIFVIFVYLYHGGILNHLFFMSILLTFLSSFILLNIVSFFSLITNIQLSVIYSIIIFGAGSVLNETSLLFYVNQRPLVLKLLKFLGLILPNFSALNIRDYVLYQNDLPLNFLIGSTAYGILYPFVILMLSCYILAKKDLD
jgi:ABC-type transport system involved in multi-copper enzyme maturation permease subunit